MAISGISSASSSAGGGTNMAQLEQQIKNLENQIKQENASKTDDDTIKAQKLEQLQLQIQQIELEIQQQAQASTRSASSSKTVGSAAQPAEESAASPGTRLDIWA